MVLPLGLSIIILLTINYGKYKRRAYTLLVFLWLFSTEIISSLLWNIVEIPWTRKNPFLIQNADFIVVLSGGMKKLISAEKKIYEWDDPDRFLAGVKLFQAKKAPKLIFTGGINPYSMMELNEGQILVKEAIKLGIRNKDLYTTKNVSNTLQESLKVANYVKKELKKEFPEIILVTSAFHMKRAKTLFERQDLKVIPYPVDFKYKANSKYYLFKNPLSYIPNAENLSSSSKALRELIGRVYYRTW